VVREEGVLSNETIKVVIAQEVAAPEAVEMDLVPMRSY